MANSTTYQSNVGQQNQGPRDMQDEDEEAKSSPSKAFGNVMHLFNDGMNRIRNRHKAE